jgi:hypothetical protein
MLSIAAIMFFGRLPIGNKTFVDRASCARPRLVNVNARAVKTRACVHARIARRAMGLPTTKR